MSLILRTNKVKKTILFSSLNLFLVMILFSCTNDDLEIKNSSSVINQLKKELKLDDFSQKNFAKNIVVNWETITTLEKEQLTIYEVQISEKNQTTIESNIFQAPLKYGLIAIKKGELMHSYLIEAYSSVNHSLYTNKIDDLAQFTGTLSVYELSGKLIGQLVVFNGKSTNTSKNNKLTLLDETINSFYISKNTTSKVPSCNMTQFVQIINVHETRHYVPTIIVGTYTNWGYTYSTYTTTITGTYMSVPYPCGTDADFHHVPYRVTTYEDVYVDPCAQIKNVMNYNPNDANSLKASLNWLKSKVNASVNNKECGIEVKKMMNPDESYRYEFAQVLSEDEFSVSLSTGSSYVGASHSHPTNGEAMFSFQDVRFLLSLYDGASSTRKGEVFNSVVCKDKAGNINTYILKIDNIDALRAQIDAVWNDPNYVIFQEEEARIKAIHKDQAKLYAKSNGQLEKSFLEQFAAFGISIYKADATLSGFNKLVLNNSTVTSISCN
ncbi:hypothetical protein FLAVO9R_120014 [Flavobacterium sp. 9R]|uniref:hypothetical protein n=1 Tax=Flavobacterium sp. 9R TaxID=2653143 RepID=UPI0012F355F8|nr:hypothetical protein [Flavobacterium sp. 9R]VXB22373.1 hypothetical protein FLAVO9R_120014 [Flavobacterium sp. 9R]